MSLQRALCISLVLFDAALARDFLGLGSRVNDVAEGYTAAALADKIVHLPGWPMSEPMPNLYSGYIPVSDDHRRQLFYMFVESANPSEDPVMLWTNGGPGSSGFEGMVLGQGPFWVNADLTLKVNQHAWHQKASMIFVEQPASVGFSLPQTELAFAEYNDTIAAMDLWSFIKGFMGRFPGAKTRPFYLSGESYGGHYIPQTALRVLEENEGDVLFKGILMGNPLINMDVRNYGQYATLAGHSLIPSGPYEQWLGLNCSTTPFANFPYRDHANITSNGGTCDSLTEMFDMLVNNTNIYALDFPVCGNGKEGVATGNYDACAMEHASKFFNNKTVQEALHVHPSLVKNPDFVWYAAGPPGGDSVGHRWRWDDLNADQTPTLLKIIENATLNFMIYSGDDDAMCSTLGSQRWVSQLLSRHAYAETESWSQWTDTDGQLGGYTVQVTAPASSKATFRFTTVHGAGHFAPSTKSGRTLDMMSKFLNGPFH